MVFKVNDRMKNLTLSTQALVMISTLKIVFNIKLKSEFSHYILMMIIFL